MVALTPKDPSLAVVAMMVMEATAIIVAKSHSHNSRVAVALTLRDHSKVMMVLE